MHAITQAIKKRRKLASKYPECKQPFKEIATIPANKEATIQKSKKWRKDIQKQEGKLAKGKF